MTFSCLDRPGVSSTMKNDKFLMNCDRFVDIGRDRGTRWNTTEKLSDSDQNLVKLGLSFSSSPSIMHTGFCMHLVMTLKQKNGKQKRHIRNTFYIHTHILS